LRVISIVVELPSDAAVEAAGISAPRNAATTDRCLVLMRGCMPLVPVLTDCA
jgi:hypothetical protein